MEVNEHIKAIRAIIQERFGLVFSELHAASFLKNISSVGAHYGVQPHAESLLKWLESLNGNQLVWDDLAKQLTVGETYFFREKAAIDLVKNELIPDFIKNMTHQSVFRIWSAGCSSGEEPYTLAITLKEAREQYGHFNFEIFATDLNPQALEKASEGRYSAWSFRETSEAVKQKYFQTKANLYEISKEIKDLVQFKKFNLKQLAGSSNLSFGHHFDVIFCRNVLMYFDPETISKIGHAFHLNLRDNGWLVTSQVELNDTYFADFVKHQYAGNFFYKKQEMNQIQLEQKIHVPLTKFKRNIPANVKNKNTVEKAKALRINTKEEQPAKNNKSNILSNSPTKNSGAVERTLQSNDTSTISPQQEVSMLQIQKLANAGNLDEALQLCALKLESEPENIQIYYFQAIIFIETAKPEEAEKALVRLLYMAPNHLAAKYTLAGVYNRLGKQKQSKKQIENLMGELDAYDDDAIIDDLEGMTAGRMRDLILKMV